MLSVALFFLLAPVLVLIITRVATTVSYYWSVRQFLDGRPLVRSPQIPYNIPWLGNARDFLSPTPGAFFDSLLSWHPRSYGVCTLLIAGKRSHVLFSTTAIQALFRVKAASRDVFDREILPKIFGFSSEQTELALAGKPAEHEITAKYLLNNESVNELTATFTQKFREVLIRDEESLEPSCEVFLYDFVRDRMFEASVRALMGERLLPKYPQFCTDFYRFDREFLKLFFGIPKVFASEVHANRERLLSKLSEWASEIYHEAGKPPDPVTGPAWEPVFGSRLNRARQSHYRNIGLNAEACAGFDLGIVFALNSNIVPAVGWMLLYLLSPEGDTTLLPRLQQELQRANRSDGSIDIAVLTALPLLQSIWSETLRFCSDVVVSRNLLEDVVLPLDDGKEVAMRKGDNIYTPSWLGQRDPAAWAGDVPIDVWQGDRFLKEDPDTGLMQFSMIGTNGKFFPFGGGKTICPGRTFAKQEGLGALAMILLTFDFEVVGRVDGDKKPTRSFPSFMKAMPGVGTISPDGDFRVRIKRRAA